MAGTVVMIGTRKGLWIATGDERRPAAWDLRRSRRAAQRGPCRRGRPARRGRDGPGCSWPASTGTGVRRCSAPTTSAAPGTRAPTARSASPRTPAARWRRSGRSPRRRATRTWSGPAPSRRRCSARPTAAGPSRWSARCGTTRTASSGAPASAGRPSTPCCRTRPTRQQVTVAMSTGGVYRTFDGGDSWAPANQGIRAIFLPEGAQFPEFGQCVHKVTRDPLDPDRLYLQNHGGVYRSDDGADSWTSIADGLPSDFGFPVVDPPAQARHRLGLPARGRRRPLPDRTARAASGGPGTPAGPGRSCAPGCPTASTPG